MMAANGSERQRRMALGISLVVLLIAVYFVTYSGYAISRDEWFLFDATESLARRGNLAQNYQFDAYPPLALADAQPPAVDAEPLQPALAAPLFLVAQALPGIGLAHTVWLFNVLVTALTAGILYAYGPVSYTHLTLPTIYSVYISVVAVSLKKKSYKHLQQTTKSHD